MIRPSAIVLAVVMIAASTAIVLAGDRDDCKNASVLAKANPDKAVLACRRLADQGEVWAQMNLAEMYDVGEGVQQSYDEAAKWYRKAADQGNVVAQYNLLPCTASVKAFRRTMPSRCDGSAKRPTRILQKRNVRLVCHIATAME